MVEKMQYRNLGNTGEKVSILGFGTMRLPHNKSNNEINEKEASKILSYGIDNGINIIDTGYSFHSSSLKGKGNCEPFIGEFLDTGYRSKILLSAKLPSWQIKKREDMDKIFNDQLERLKTDYIDIYMLHGLTEDYWSNYKSLNVFEFLDNLLEEGKIKHVGFSAHVEFDTLMNILDDYDKWEVVLSQMNYLDENYKSGLAGLNLISSMGMGNIIMEPLRGGKLVQNIPKDIKDMWDSADVKRTPVEWALNYLWNMKNISCVFSGMNSLEQVKENIDIASNFKFNSISENDAFLIQEVAREYRFKRGNDCTSCQYCMPCPNGVNIPNCFKEYNVAKMLNNPKASAMHYFNLIPEESRADKCNNCNKCLNFCPQLINIPEELEKVNNLFGNEFNYF
jgi:predicted aldo/keto reductase-like oxidoreductase